MDGILAEMPVPEPPMAGRDPSAPRLLLLNAVFPGLGHLVAGRRRWAIALAGPVLGLLLVAAAVALTSHATSLAARVFDPQVLAVLLAVELAVLGWRLVALVAVRAITPFRPRDATLLLATALGLLIVIGPQLYLANITLAARDAAAEVYAPVVGGGAWIPAATAPPVASNDPDFGVAASPSEQPSASPTPTPTPEVPRINVLLIGIDSGVGRNTAATDTMIVASLDPVGRTVSMASVPRDMVDVPLPDGRTFRAKINSLVSYVRWHPTAFPGANDGESVLAAAIGKLLDLDIAYWAEVNLGGFVNLVNSVGGVTVNVTKAFCDPNYKEYGVTGFGVSPGRYHMNGDQALAYARIRKAAGESDFTRAARQQEVIAALRDRLVQGAFLGDPARFLRSLGRTIRTNVQPGVLADDIDLVSSIPRSDVFRVVIQHPLVRSGYDARGSIQVPDIPAIRDLAARLFTPTGVRPVGFATMPSAGSGATRNASSSTTCGITPTPAPTAAPTASPSASPTPGATATPSPAPTPTSPAATPSPTASPSPTPTTGAGTPSPTASPTASPAASPSPSPSPGPSSNP